jgi:hypothetical protein
MIDHRLPGLLSVLGDWLLGKLGTTRTLHRRSRLALSRPNPLALVEFTASTVRPLAALIAPRDVANNLVAGCHVTTLQGTVYVASGRVPAAEGCPQLDVYFFFKWQAFSVSDY